MNRDIKSGKKPKWNCYKWLSETKNRKRLPDKVTKKKRTKKSKRSKKEVKNNNI